MPSPLAHGGLALAAWYAAGPSGSTRAQVLSAGVAVVASGVPDLDIVPDLLDGGGIAFHHGPMHSLVFALCASAALLAGLSRAPRGAATRAAAIAGSFALLIHAPLDYLTGEPGAPSKYGVEWLWPASDARFISADPFFGAYHIDQPGSLAHMVTPDAWGNYAREAEVVLAGFVAALLIRGWRAGGTRGAGPPRGPTSPAP